MQKRVPTDLLSGATYLRQSFALTRQEWRAMFDPRSVAPNVLAGLTVTMVALPLNVALAIAAGLSPAAGLVAGAVAGLLCALLGGTRLSVTGPEVALAPITLEIVSRHGLHGLAAATLLAGLLQIVFGLLRIGHLVHAIPLPVVSGFLAAVGLLVFETQLPRLLGLSAEVKSIADFSWSEHGAAIQLESLAIGALVVAVMVLSPRLSRRAPAPLLALSAAVLVVASLNLGLPTISGFQATFPTPSVPSLAKLDLLALLPEALALALLASIDSLLCAVSIDALSGGERARTDQELIAQGLANIASGCFSGMPVAAAVVRSVAGQQAGASTRLAALVQSLSLVVVLVVLSPLLTRVPLVSLAAVLLVVGYRLVQWRTLIGMWRTARFELAIFVATAGGILATDFVFGVTIGVIAALAHFAHQQRVTVRAESPGALQPEEGRGAGEPQVVRLAGPIFFGSQRSVEDSLFSLRHAQRIVVDLSQVSTMDISGATALANALEQLAQRGTRIEVSAHDGRFEPLLRWVLERNGKRDWLTLRSARSDGARGHLQPLAS